MKDSRFLFLFLETLRKKACTKSVSVAKHKKKPFRRNEKGAAEIEKWRQYFLFFSFISFFFLRGNRARGPKGIIRERDGM